MVIECFIVDARYVAAALLNWLRICCGGSRTPVYYLLSVSGTRPSRRPRNPDVVTPRSHRSIIRTKQLLSRCLPATPAVEFKLAACMDAGQIDTHSSFSSSGSIFTSFQLWSQAKPTDNTQLYEIIRPLGGRCLLIRLQRRSRGSVGSAVHVQSASNWFRRRRRRVDVAGETGPTERHANLDDERIRCAEVCEY